MATEPKKPAIQEKGPNSLADAFAGHALSLSSRAVHADDFMNSTQAVAPPLHVSTTFRYTSNPEELAKGENVNPNAPHDSHIYSRYSAPNTTRFEAVLGSVLGGPAVTYSSGLSAFHALLVMLNPRRVFIGKGYHGCHSVLVLFNRLTGCEVLDLDTKLDMLRPGDLVHVETPVNPTGEMRDLANIVAMVAKVGGCYVSVDSTFGPPPLQDPLAMGADVVMHSGTKYLGGHSDMLCGVLAVHPDRAVAGKPTGDQTGKGDDGKNWAARLRADRAILGSVMGNLEGWLGARSIRTLELRVQRQSASATRLVAWLASELKDGESTVSRTVAEVKHASLQVEGRPWIAEQMPGGFSPVFAVVMNSEKLAKHLPSKLQLFHHATSLGGVESLVEWRAMSDSGIDARLLRFSIGVEGWKDLREDMAKGFAAVSNEAGADKTVVIGV